MSHACRLGGAQPSTQSRQAAAAAAAPALPPRHARRQRAVRRQRLHVAAAASTDAPVSRHLCPRLPRPRLQACPPLPPSRHALTRHRPPPHSTHLLTPPYPLYSLHPPRVQPAATSPHKLSPIELWNGKRLQTVVADVADDTITIRSLDWDRDRFDIEFALQEGTTYNRRAPTTAPPHGAGCSRPWRRSGEEGRGL